VEILGGKIGSHGERDGDLDLDYSGVRLLPGFFQSAV